MRNFIYFLAISALSFALVACGASLTPITDEVVNNLRNGVSFEDTNEAENVVGGTVNLELDNLDLKSFGVDKVSLGVGSDSNAPVAAEVDVTGFSGGELATLTDASFEEGDKLFLIFSGEKLTESAVVDKEIQDYFLPAKEEEEEEEETGESDTADSTDAVSALASEPQDAVEEEVVEEEPVEEAVVEEEPEVAVIPAQPVEEEEVESEPAIYQLDDVNFDFDKSVLKYEAQSYLDSELLQFSSFDNINVSLIGHTDERGTNEYNLRLGERRALAVRDYLVIIGVPEENINYSSMGEEAPKNPAGNESAWAENRRVETILIIR